VERFDIRRRNVRRVVIHSVEEAPEHFLVVGNRRRFEIIEDRADEVFVAQQLRRDRGVRLRSKGAVVPLGGSGGDQLAEAG
jgi:hypothetical protein